MDTEKIKQQADIVARAQKNLTQAHSDYAKVKGLGGQVGYNVSISGVSIAVAYMNKSWQGELIRGREMLHLGALKALDAMIDFAKQELSKESAKLVALVAAGYPKENANDQ